MLAGKKQHGSVSFLIPISSVREKPEKGDIYQQNITGGIMSLNDARSFVTAMRENFDFRNNVLATGGSEELIMSLREKGMSFDLRELAGAMAECMAQLEQQMKSDKCG
jgi:hypothetical protein